MFDDLDPSMMLITALLFLILIWILNDILYKPLLDFMQKRDDGIAEDEARISQSNADATNNETLISKIYADARVKAQNIKNEQIALSKEKAKKMLEEQSLILEAEFNSFLSNLENDKKLFREELKNKLDENALNLKNKVEFI